MRRMLSTVVIALAFSGGVALAGDRDACDTERRDEAAIAACTRLIERGPQSEELADIYYRRGMKYRSNTDYARAIKDFGDAIRLKPDWAWPYVARGHAYAWTKQFDKAIADQEKAIKLEPSHVTYVGRGMDLVSAGRVREAIADFDEALRLNKDYFYARINRAHAYMKLDRFKEALADYRAALEIGSASEGDKDVARDGIKKAKERLQTGGASEGKSLGNRAD